MSEGLIRLPLHNQLNSDDVDFVCLKVIDFLKKELFNNI